MSDDERVVDWVERTVGGTTVLPLHAVEMAVDQECRRVGCVPSTRSLTRRDPRPEARAAVTSTSAC